MPKNNSIVKTCSIEGCTSAHYGHDLCVKHHRRFRRNGDPLTVLRIQKDDHARFDSYVEMIPFSTCWYWVGWTNENGYGRINISGKMLFAHRYNYERYVGPISDGLFVLHKCDTPLCCNPDHLELGTNTDNMRQMLARGRGRYQKE